jgi:hypothetical protein
MGRFDRIAQGVLRPINPYSTLILGVFTGLWGLWVLLPQWDVFTSAALFSKVSEFAPEYAWGLWALTCGVIICAGIATGARRILSFALAFAMWHWWTIAGMFWWGDWQNTGGITYTFVAITCTYAWLNFKVNFVKTGTYIIGTKF